MFSLIQVMVDLVIWLIAIEAVAIRERHRRLRLIKKWLKGDMTEEEIEFLKKQTWFKWKPKDTDPPCKKFD